MAPRPWSAFTHEQLVKRIRSERKTAATERIALRKRIDELEDQLGTKSEKNDG